ncbi:hypothetical protein VP01_1769g1 [Puccinia sorghi]|uniref:Uncharacterized protein n=1 Tax=Puccinia sorghi TaxID=27349 RepID=A0A0L6VES1_9BASI|nr:hypothetical protein VP01_1769g1 [Puccinia sorghi]
MVTSSQNTIQVIKLDNKDDIDPSKSSLSVAAKQSWASKLAPKSYLIPPIAYFITKANLPFLIFECKYFYNLICLVNDQEKFMMEFLAKQQWVFFTQDVWTPPNVNSFLEFTAHFVNENFQMVNLMIAVPHIQGHFSFLYSYPRDVSMALTCKCFL